MIIPSAIEIGMSRIPTIKYIATEQIAEQKLANLSLETWNFPIFSSPPTKSLSALLGFAICATRSAHLTSINMILVITCGEQYKYWGCSFWSSRIKHSWRVTALSKPVCTTLQSRTFAPTKAVIVSRSIQEKLKVPWVALNGRPHFEAARSFERGTNPHVQHVFCVESLAHVMDVTASYVQFNCKFLCLLLHSRAKSPAIS